MGMTCTLCSHEKRVEIDKALILGVTERGIARQYGRDKSAVHRHRSCIANLLAKADKRIAGRIALRVEGLIGQLEEMAREAHDAKAARAFLDAVRELRPTYELGAKLNGEMQAASVQAFLAAIGVRTEAEVRSALDLTRSSELATVDEIEREAIEALRMVLGEKPDRLLPILAALGGISAAGDAPALEAHQANGNGASAANGGRG